MKSTDLLLRCIAEEKDGYWQAFCLDLNLAAQGDSLEDVKIRLESMICSYVMDATVGDDRKYAAELLNRPAPLRFWLRYYAYSLMSHTRMFRKNMHQLFIEALPLTPACHP